VQSAWTMSSVAWLIPLAFLRIPPGRTHAFTLDGPSLGRALVGHVALGRWAFLVCASIAEVRLRISVGSAAIDEPLVRCNDSVRVVLAGLGAAQARPSVDQLPALALICMVLTCVPWTIRNYLVLPRSA
jgi:hypothetical protein